MNSNRYTLIAALGLAIAAGGCADSEQSGISGSATVTALTLADVLCVDVTVTGDGIDPPITQILTRVGSTNEWSGTVVSVPAGTNRVFTAVAYDGPEVDGACTGTPLYDGASPPQNTGETTILVLINLQQIDEDANPPFFNVVPVIVSATISDVNPAPGTTVDFTAVINDPDFGAGTVDWTQSAGSILQDPGDTTAGQWTTTATWTTPAVGGLEAVTITVTDEQLAEASLTFNVEVVEPTSEADAVVQAFLQTDPIINSIVPTQSRVLVGESTILNTDAVDPDGTELAYLWATDCEGGSFVDNEVQNPELEISTIQADGSLNCTVGVTVTDSNGGSNTGRVIIYLGYGVISCDPIAPLCPFGEGCYPASGSNFLCAPAGVGAEGEPCSEEVGASRACGEGLLCGATSGGSLCFRICDPSIGNCPNPSFPNCVEQITGVFGVCT